MLANKKSLVFSPGIRAAFEPLCTLGRLGKEMDAEFDMCAVFNRHVYPDDVYDVSSGDSLEQVVPVASHSFQGTYKRFVYHFYTPRPEDF